jgi:hypothetical protein
MSQDETINAIPAPLPWNWKAVSANASGGCHLYLVDANGRNIAAIWGRHPEKQATAQLIVDSVNATLAKQVAA